MLRPLVILGILASLVALAPDAAASPNCAGGEPAPKDHALVYCIVWCGDDSMDPLAADPLCLAHPAPVPP